jgi:hypothetical protein
VAHLQQLRIRAKSPGRRRARGTRRSARLVDFSARDVGKSFRFDVSPPHGTTRARNVTAETRRGKKPEKALSSTRLDVIATRFHYSYLSDAVAEDLGDRLSRAFASLELSVCVFRHLILHGASATLLRSFSLCFSCLHRVELAVNMRGAHEYIRRGERAWSRSSEANK